eukprot:6891711-Alexandrium_andersonii.AAC.1
MRSSALLGTAIARSASGWGRGRVAARGILAAACFWCLAQVAGCAGPDSADAHPPCCACGPGLREHREHSERITMAALPRLELFCLQHCSLSDGPQPHLKISQRALLDGLEKWLAAAWRALARKVLSKRVAELPLLPTGVGEACCYHANIVPAAMLHLGLAEVPLRQWDHMSANIVARLQAAAARAASSATALVQLPAAHAAAETA